MRILVTGGSGFIGSNFIEHRIMNTDDFIINYSRHTYAINPRVLQHLEGKEQYKFVAGDICDAIKLMHVLQKYEPDIIVHFAAETHVDRSFIYPKEFFQTNVGGTLNLLEVIRHTKCEPLLIYISTDEVFGDVPTGKCKETDMRAPRNPYSASKAAAEMYINAYHYSFKIRGLIMRSTNNYGPRQHPEKLIAKIITRALSDRPFTLYEGQAVRDWIYVKDTARAIDTVIEKGIPGEIYHIGTYQHKTVGEVASIILKLMNKEHLFQGYKGRRLQDDERYCLDWSKLQSLGWEPKYTFEEGIQETIEWYKNNPWFWRGVDSP